MAGLTNWLILMPLAGALVVGVLPAWCARRTAYLFCAIAAVVTGAVWWMFDSAQGGVQLVNRCAWIPAFGVEYAVGVDGVGMLLVLLATVLVPFAIVAADRHGPVRSSQEDKLFCALLLLLQAALNGTFTARNFVLWFLCYEAALIPAFLLIRLAGTDDAGRRKMADRAATKFFLFTFFGSVLMLLGMLAVWLHGGTLDFDKFAALGRAGGAAGPLTWLAFAGVFIGLAVKVPVVPLHTWLPDAYTAAPTGVAMVLTGALSKMGVLGFLRILLPLFPAEIGVARPVLLTLAVASVVGGALAAWVQQDAKRMVAYLSVNHLGYCTLGLMALSGATPGADAQATLAGVSLQMFNHGVTAAVLFWFVGLLELRRGARGLADFGGLMQQTPALCGWFSVAMFASLGLPGLNGFISEFLIFKGVFTLAPVAAAVSVLGLLFCATTFLRAMQAWFGGPLADGCANLPDLAGGEKVIALAASAVMLAVGIAPQTVLGMVNATVVTLTRLLGS